MVFRKKVNFMNFMKFRNTNVHRGVSIARLQRMFSVYTYKLFSSNVMFPCRIGTYFNDTTGRESVIDYVVT